MQAEVPRDAMVIRFRPVEPSRAMEWAAKEYRRTGRYRLSVFASVSRHGEHPGARVSMAETLIGGACQQP